MATVIIAAASHESAEPKCSDREAFDRSLLRSLADRRRIEADTSTRQALSLKIRKTRTRQSRHRALTHILVAIAKASTSLGPKARPSPLAHFRNHADGSLTPQND